MEWSARDWGCTQEYSNKAVRSLSVFDLFSKTPSKTRNYSKVPNKRTGPNKSTGEIFCQNR